MFQRYFNKTFTYTQSNKYEETAEFYHYPVNWVVFSWFAGFGLAVYFMYRTLITIDNAFHIFLLFGALGTCIHYFLTPKRQFHMLLPMAFYNFFGVAALACGLFLALNFSFHGQPYAETFPITEVNKDPRNGQTMNAHEVTLSPSYINDFKYFLNFSQWDWQEFRKARSIRITFTEGLFGYKIYQDATLVYE